MGLVQQDQQGQPTLTCPTCRQVTPIPVSGVAGLQENVHAIQLLKILGDESALRISDEGQRTPTKYTIIQDAERKHRVYQRVIKAKCLVELCVLIFNYLGLPRSGKTSFRRRIMGEIVNILQAGEIDQPSTGVVEDGGQVMLLSKTEMGAITASKVWTVLTKADEANMLSQLLHQVAQHFFAKSSRDTNAKSSMDNASVSTDSTVLSSEHLESLEVPEFQLSSASNSIDDTNPSASADILNEDKEMLSILGEAFESDSWDKVKYLLEDLTLISNNDTGGHAEFHDLHAAFIHGPSFNLFFSCLPDKLDEVYEISYTNKKGESTLERNSTVTVEEVLFQALASVSCFGCPYFEESDKIFTEKRKELYGNITSKFMLVCTHLDVIEDEKERERKFDYKDKLLRKKLETTEFYRQGIIEYVSEDQLMIKADNLNGDEQEIKSIRDTLMTVIGKSFNQKTKIPASWLILSLYLRKYFCTISLERCQEIASKLRIDSEELQDALWFLHHCVGALLYYPEVEAMRNTVICKRQVVFDSASKLIQETFTIDKVGHCRCMEFREKGQFSHKDIEKVVKMTDKEAECDFLIPLDKLVSLFKHRNILTPIVSPSADEVTYFMPCVLRSASKEQLQVLRGKIDPPSLMLCYECGYMPLGIFPAIITNLVSQQQKHWRLIEEGLYKNRVQFHVGSDLDEVTLMSHPRYFEIAIKRTEPFEVPTKSLCAYVGSIFLSTLGEVTSNMNYHFNMQYNLAFECPSHPRRDHLAIIPKGSNKMLCLENPKRPKPLPLQDHHKMWHSTIELHVFNPAVCVCGSSESESSTLLQPQTLACGDLSKVTKHLKDLSNQEITNIGVTLGIHYTRFKRMSAESLMDDMVLAWLRKDDDVAKISGDPSWKTLCTALKECGHTGIALNIEKKELARS